MDNTHQTELLENTFAALVLILANQLKEQKKAKGVTSTSDFVSEAIHLINQKKGRILQVR